MTKLKKSQFKFLKNDRLGTEAAEDDTEFLNPCFVDSGDLGVLRDVQNPMRIVVGRTGTGKTALLLQLARAEDHVAFLEPERLALQYLANSSILPRLEELGVSLDIFYRLLWRHILAVELIRLKYHLRTEADSQSFLQRIRERFLGDKSKKAALDYLLEWGDHFWEDAEYRIHEVTNKFETDLQSSLGAKSPVLTASAEEFTRYSTEDRKEIVHRLQSVVDNVQIRQLSIIMDTLASDVFDDAQEHFFVLIDRLDESWVDDPLRYRLIRALVETIRDLRRISNAKVVMALRLDLLERVFRETRDSGFQEEKYQPLFLNIKWNKKQLIAVLDKRIGLLVRHRYTSATVGSADLFPSHVGNVDIDEYLVTRTMYRPRDIIQFANCTIQNATERSDISVGVLRAAEADYSAKRLRSLGDEWIADYPSLLDSVNLLKQRPPAFSLVDLPLDDIDKFMYEVLARDDGGKGKLSAMIRQCLDNQITMEDVRRRLVKVFYKVGLVGIRIEPGHRVSWSFLDDVGLSSAEIGDQARIEICPVFYRVLGTALRS